MKQLIFISTVVILLFAACSKTNDEPPTIQPPIDSPAAPLNADSNLVRIVNGSPGCTIAYVDNILDWYFGIGNLTFGQRRFGEQINGARGHSAFESEIEIVITKNPTLRTVAELYRNSVKIDSLDIYTTGVHYWYYFNSHKFEATDTITVKVYTPRIYLFLNH